MLLILSSRNMRACCILCALLYFLNVFKWKNKNIKTLVILQVGTLEWVAIPFLQGIFRSRDWTQVSCIAGRFFTVWATRKALLLNSPW